MSEPWQAIVSSVVGIVFVVLARLVDRWLPDADNKHPIPPPPSTPAP